MARIVTVFGAVRRGRRGEDTPPYLQAPVGRNTKIQDPNTRESPGGRPPGEMPSLWRQAWNAGKAAVRVGKQALEGGAVVAPEGVQLERRAICEACPHLTPKKRCLLCGCRTRGLVNKIAVATEQCPDFPPRWLAWNESIKAKG